MNQNHTKMNMIVHIYTSLIMQIHYNISLTFAVSFYPGHFAQHSILSKQDFKTDFKSLFI